MPFRSLLVVGLGSAALGLGASAAAPVRVLLLDGESGGPYHKWQLTSQVLQRQLSETGLFDVETLTAPPAGADFSTFKPSFGQYAAVVLNYDAPDERWPEDLKRSFEEYVRGGGGLVVVHAADNAFPSWAAFNEMIGVGGWRGRTEKHGPYWHVQDGRLVADTAPGPAGAHGARSPFAITTNVTDHPITRGLPPVWMHQGDELYSKLRGPGKNMTVLASAWADPANAGTGRYEPILMVLSYGKGRVFHTTLGHDVNGMSCVGFTVTLQRGTEWAATGGVTQKVPANFPTDKVVAYRADLAAIDPNFKFGLNALDNPKR